MPCRATQDRWIMVDSSDKMWSTAEGNGKLVQYSCLENPMNSMKRQKYRTLKDELHRSVGTQYGAAIRVNKRVQNAVLGRNLKNDRMISVCLKANHSILQLSKSIPQQVMLKKLKLISSMKTYKTF